MSPLEAVALYPEPGDVVRLRCGRVSYTVTDNDPQGGGGKIVQRTAVEGGDTVTTPHVVDHTAWRDLVRLGASSVETFADRLAPHYEARAALAVEQREQPRKGGA